MKEIKENIINLLNTLNHFSKSDLLFLHESMSSEIKNIAFETKVYFQCIITQY